MRITERRMIEVAGATANRARASVSKAADLVSSGIRVRRASDDPVGFADGARASFRLRESDAHENAIGRAKERLEASDSALATLTNLLHRVTELAVSGATEVSSTFRQAAGLEVQALRANAIAAVNSRGPDGEYLFSSFNALVAPFDTATGAYLDGNAVRSVDVGPGISASESVPGSRLTNIAGPPDVNVFTIIDNISAALLANNAAGVQAELDNLQQALKQVVEARGEVGGYLQALDQAEVSRVDLTNNLHAVKSRAVESDSIAAASQLAAAENALDAARTAAREVIQMANPFR